MIINYVLAGASLKYVKSVIISISLNDDLRRFSYTVHFNRERFSSLISTLQNVHIRSLTDNLVFHPQCSSYGRLVDRSVPV